MSTNEPVVTMACVAMNTRFEIALWGRDRTYLNSVAEEALREIRALDQQLSFYRSDSDVRALNLHAARVPVPVEPRLFHLLQRAKEISERTAGAFDPTAGPLIRCWGFAGEGGRVPTPEEIDQARAITGVRHLHLDSEEYTVRFDAEGVTLDLGAIGKGYALERAGDILREHALPGAILHGGTSSVYALGAPPGGDAWRVSIRHPTRPDDRIATIALHDRGLGVSAPHGKFFEREGQRYGHVLDPRTGRPAASALLSAVVVDSPTEADALSTALLTLGEPGLEVLEAEWPGAQALLALESDAMVRVAAVAWEGAG